MIQKYLALLSLLLLCFSSSSPKINFGDKHAGIKIASGASFSVIGEVDISGTIIKDEGATITGNGSLSFINGIFEDEGTASAVTGSYNPTTNELLLAGNQRLVVQPGSLLAALKISGANNVLRGEPLFTDAITLIDSDSELMLGLQTELTQNIVLNSGTASLSDNLTFAGSAFFTGPGTINSNTRIIHTGHDALTVNTDLTLANTTHLTLHGPVALSGTWTCQGNVCINGNGEGFDFGTGDSAGQIVIASGATLTLTDMQLKNVGNTLASGPVIKFTDATSKLRLAKVDASFIDAITYTAGTIEIIANTTFSLKQHQLLFDGATLLVNGAMLSYDTVEYEFANINDGQISLINNGELNDINSVAAMLPLAVDGSATLTSNFILDPFNKMSFSLTEAGTLTADFSGHDITFSNSTSTQMVVNSGVDAVLTDVIVKNFVPAAVSVAESATLTFGDNSWIELATDQTLDKMLDFSGTAVLNGNGQTLTISDTNRIRVGSSSTLTIKNVTLRGVDNLALQGMATSSTIILENVTLELADDAVLAQGAWKIEKEVTVIGGKKLSYTSAQALTIQPHSTLHIIDESTYVYDPSSDTQTALLFADRTAKLSFSNSAFEVADAGALLTKGTIVINDAATFKSLASGLDDAIILGDGASASNNVVVKIGPRATLIVDSGVLRIRDA